MNSPVQSTFLLKKIFLLLLSLSIFLFVSAYSYIRDSSLIHVVKMVSQNQTDITGGQRHDDVHSFQINMSSKEHGEPGTTNFLPFLKDIVIGGMIDVKLQISKNHDSSAMHINWKLDALIKDLFISSTTFTVNMIGRSIHVTARGDYNWGSRSAEIYSLKAELSEFKPLLLKGRLMRIFSDSMEVDLTVKGVDIPLHEVKDIISGPALRWLDNIELNGYADADLLMKGEVRSPNIDGRISIRGERVVIWGAEVHSLQAHIPLLYQDNVISLRNVSMDAKEIGIKESDGSGDLYVRAQGIKFSVPSLEFRYPQLRSGNLRFKASKVLVAKGEKKLYEDTQMTVTSAIMADMSVKELSLHDLSLNSDFLDPIHGTVTAHMNEPATIDAQISYKSFDLNKLSQRFSSGLLRDTGYTIHGQVDILSSVRIIIPEKAAAHMTGTTVLSSTNAGFSSPDATRIGEGIAINISNTFEFPLSLEWIEFSSVSEATGFELLIGKFYGNFDNKILKVAGRGRYTKADQSLRLSHSEIRLDDVGTIVLQGALTQLFGSPVLDVEMQLAHLSNKEIFNFIIREIYQERFPTLSDVTVDGTGSAALSVKGTVRAFGISGDITVSDMNIVKTESGNYIKDIHISFPIDISYPEAVHNRPPEGYGKIHIGDCSWSFLQFQDLTVIPLIWQNALIFRENVTLPLFGGTVVFMDVSFSDLLSQQRAFRLAIDIQDISLRKASVAISLPEFSGRLTGTIPRVTIVRDMIQTEGEIILDVFNGRIRMNGLSAENLFSPIMSFKSTTAIDNIDLGELTETFEFGNISGTLRGTVENLVIVNGQAQSFTASLETVKTKGITQKVSVEALKKISILGTGTATSLFDRGIYSLFKTYRYDKMGFKASLRNDTLLLRGIERDGRKEFLVKSGLLPPKVDIVTFSHKISFNEMVDRLKRIRQAEKE